MFKKTKTIFILSIVAIIIIIGSILYYFNIKAFDEKKIQTLIEKEYIGKYTKIGDFTNIDYYNQREPELILTKYDNVKPIYSILENDCIFNKVQGVNKEKKDCDSFSVQIAYLERVGIVDWKVTDLKSINISKTSYEKAKQTIKNYDISSIGNEKDGQVIYVGIPVTPAQIEKAIKDKQQDEQIKKDQETFKNSPAQEKIKTLENNIKRGQEAIAIYEKGGKEYDGIKLTPEIIDLTKKDIENIKLQIATLKKENGLE